MSKTVGLLDYLSKSGTMLPEKTIHVEQWGRAVTLRGFTSRERDLWEEDCLRLNRAKSSNGRQPSRGEVSDPDLTNFRARLVARSIVEDGVRTCWNDRGEELLGNQPASVIDPLFAAAQHLHGMSDADVEAMAGNLDETGESVSSSVSPSPSTEPLPN